MVVPLDHLNCNRLFIVIFASFLRPINTGASEMWIRERVWQKVKKKGQKKHSTEKRLFYSEKRHICGVGFWRFGPVFYFRVSRKHAFSILETLSDMNHDIFTLFRIQSRTIPLPSGRLASF